MPAISSVSSSSDLHSGEFSSGPKTQGLPESPSHRSVPSPSPLLVNLAPRERSVGRTLTPYGRQLAGYLRGRVSMNKAIDGDELEDLKSSQVSLARTRTVLKPANVVTADMQLDVEAYAKENTATELSRQLCATLERAVKDPSKPPALKDIIPFEEIDALGGDQHDRYFLLGERMLVAACGLYAGVAVCDKFSRAALALHAPRLRDNQTVVVMGCDHPVSHSWMHVHDPALERQDIVQDGWAEGPVVLAEDSRCASGQEQPLPAGPALSLTDAQIFAQGVAKILGRLRSNPTIETNFQRRSAQKKAMFEAYIAHPDGGVGKLLGTSGAMHVLSDSFINNLRRVLQQENESSEAHATLTNEIRSAGVCRAMGLNVKSATRKQNIDDIDAATHEIIATEGRRDE